jgi:hypothetical protein
MTAAEPAPVTSEIVTYAEGAAIFDKVCRRDLGVSAEEFLAEYDRGGAHIRWGHRADSVTMLVPFTRSVPSKPAPEWLATAHPGDTVILRTPADDARVLGDDLGRLHELNPDLTFIIVSADSDAQVVPSDLRTQAIVNTLRDELAETRAEADRFGSALMEVFQAGSPAEMLRIAQAALAVES